VGWIDVIDRFAEGVRGSASFRTAHFRARSERRDVRTVLKLSGKSLEPMSLKVVRAADADVEKCPSSVWSNQPRAAQPITCRVNWGLTGALPLWLHSWAQRR